jgi:hypothetical protein
MRLTRALAAVALTLAQAGGAKAELGNCVYI